MVFGAFATTTQWYLYGRKYFTANGYLRASAKYDAAALDALDLSGKIFLVTGANSGLGRSISEFIASRDATLYMVCRSAERGHKARDEIISQTGNSKVHTLIADVSLGSSVRAAMLELSRLESRLDGVVCNAGAITADRTITAEGYEVTLAAGLINGAYLLSTLAMPLLRRSAEPRVVYVSSGGMYNSRWPGWAAANSEDGQSYNKEMAYVYTKRGQVLLAEEMARRYGGSGPDSVDGGGTSQECGDTAGGYGGYGGGGGGGSGGVAFVSCHPGWTLTPGVEGWLGSGALVLRPLRSLWQGAEAIAWLAVCPRRELSPGAFYLDRTPQTKHLSGPFFSEGSYTKNTREEVDAMMVKLAAAADAVTAAGGGTCQPAADTSAAVLPRPLPPPLLPLLLPPLLPLLLTLLLTTRPPHPRQTTPRCIAAEKESMLSNALDCGEGSLPGLPRADGKWPPLICLKCFPGQLWG